MTYPLLTSRLSIEPLRWVDIETFVEYRQDPVVARFQGWDTSYSLELGNSLLESQCEVLIPEQGDWLQLGITHRETGELVGDVAVHNVEVAETTFELGFTVARRHQNNGYATEAVTEVIRFLREETGCQRFVANTDRRNAASIGLLTSLGFREVPADGWTEEFKGETVEVAHFEWTI